MQLLYRVLQSYLPFHSVFSTALCQVTCCHYLVVSYKLLFTLLLLLLLLVFYTVSKNVRFLVCYNLDMHQPI